MSNRELLLEQRKKRLSQLLGKPYENVVEHFTNDLLGCLSGGSNERHRAREWLLFCFHQYFGSGDYDIDEKKRDEVYALLGSFIEPTDGEIESELARYKNEESDNDI